MWNYRFIIETGNMKSFSEKHPDFDVFQDMEILAEEPTWCIIRTYKLLETLMFMQENNWKLYDLLPDDEWDMEYNILTMYKPKQPKKSF